MWFKFKNVADAQLVQSHSRSRDGAVNPLGHGLSRRVGAPLAPHTPTAQTRLGAEDGAGVEGQLPTSG